MVKNDSILVTGITGFIGNHLYPSLAGEVYGVVEWTHKDEEYGDYNYIFADLRDQHKIKNIVSRIQPEVVVHLGAISPVSLSFDRPHQYMEVNAIGTVNLAEANLRNNPNLEKFVFAGTPEEYGLQKNFPIKEEAMPHPQSPYAVSKVSATNYLLYLYRSHDFPAVISRHGNCFGRKRNSHFVVEAIVTQMIENSGKVELGNPEAVRDFLYIEDVVKVYKLLIQEGEPGEIYNFGNEALSIQELAEIAAEVTGFEGDTVWNTQPQRPGTIPRIELDDSKARNELGWEPEFSVRDGIENLAEYWK